MIESLQNLWHSFLSLISGIVIPDWAALINLLPVLLFFGVIAPVLSLVLLAWLVYGLRRPRAHARFAQGPRRAETGGAGALVLPRGEPFCLRDSLIFPSGSTWCDVCHQELTLLCSRCGVGQAGSAAACGNCGLSLRTAPRARALRPTGPPRGGAAAA